jgi:5'-3' exoribonuclease 1
VLPTASANFLPAPYQRLMLDPNSPIRDFYPEKWEQDMEGKRAEWEAIVLIPFISEARLLQAEATFVTPGM